MRGDIVFVYRHGKAPHIFDVIDDFDDRDETIAVMQNSIGYYTKRFSRRPCGFQG